MLAVLPREKAGLALAAGVRVLDRRALVAVEAGPAPAGLTKVSGRHGRGMQQAGGPNAKPP